MNLKKLLRNKKNRKTTVYLCLCFFLCFATQIQAQKIAVSGVVTNSEDGMPVPGLSVVIKNTNKGVVTDFDGMYTIKAKVGDVLTFSYVGMQEMSVKVSGTKHNVIMTALLESLEEVVVIGYGTQKKKEVTGAVAQVKSEEIENFITADLGSALQGQIAGVSVTSTSGQPGDESSILIRGITSLQGSNEPLYVVDGIPQVGNPGISPTEIETIDVLKDAGSTAVYGARGAAGVILITTKRGKDGKMQVTYTTTYGIQRLNKGLPLMNAEDQLYFNIAGRYYNDGVLTELTQSKWLNNDNSFTDYVVRPNAATDTHVLNITGGNKDFSYNAVAGYLNQEGVIINSGFKKYNGRISTTYNSDNWSISSSIAMSTQKQTKISTALFQNAAFYSPLFPKVNPDSDVAYSNGNGSVTTPLNRLLSSIRGDNTGTSERTNASLSIRRNFGENFSVTARGGAAIRTDINNNFNPSTKIIDITDNSIDDDPTKSSVSAEAIRSIKSSVDLILNYKKSIGDHNFNATTSLSIESQSKESFEASRQGVANNEIKVINGGTINPQAFSGSSGINLTKNTVGTMGRIQYNYKGKYLFSALARYDGSSRFGSDYRWGVFPTVSAGWNVSDEAFWDSIKGTVNNMRVRASYGKVGNDSFSDYEYQSTLAQGSDYIFDTTDSVESFGAIVKSYSNADVKWETSIQTNIGIDMGFFRNKLTVSADYYKTNKEDMLFPVRLPGSAGAVYDSSLVLNVGNMSNEGFELATKYRYNIGKSKINVGLTFATNKNEVTKMFGDTDLIYNSGSNIGGNPTTVLSVGREAGSFWLYKTAGIINDTEELAEYQQFSAFTSTAKMGDIKLVDTNKDGDITEDDRVYSGSGLPGYEIGFNYSWMYANWDLSMNWYSTLGSEIINAQKREAYVRGRHQDQISQWTPDNPNSNIPSWEDKADANFIGTTDYWLEDGDYLRLKLVTLGYNLPKQVCTAIGLSSLRVYATGQNLLTFTKYSGFEPEIGGNVQKRGIDLDRYPTSALYSMGIKVSF
ncbi:SusC/RagA family TonB-linked outer membrane protein [Flavicella sediminum]|uniref:SusC/RagA family TonB-linked outer membrane protein n=1 Tax=Flavicella sediminum TaxID=2585141 RepID=UPI0011210AB8|nr:TonB-dependent receptor [Flavicella sediminum]